MTTLARIVAIAAALDATLSATPFPLQTTALAGEIARRTGEPAAFVSGLLTFLSADHPAAHHDGPTFQQYGKTCRRWLWYPNAAEGTPTTPKALAPAEPVTGAETARQARIMTEIIAQLSLKPHPDPRSIPPDLALDEPITKP